MTEFTFTVTGVGAGGYAGGTDPTSGLYGDGIFRWYLFDGCSCVYDGEWTPEGGGDTLQILSPVELLSCFDDMTWMMLTGNWADPFHSPDPDTFYSVAFATLEEKDDFCVNGGTLTLSNPHGYADGWPATITLTPTGTVATCAECPCDCECSAGFGGLFTEFMLTVADLINSDGILGPCDCPTLNGSWTLKWRGGCVWSTDDSQPDGPCNDAGHPVWELICQDGDWLLTNPISGTTFQSAVSGGTFNTFDGGTMVPTFGVGPECEATGATASLESAGYFIPCVMV